MWEGESRYGADELLRAPADDEERAERDEAVAFIRGFLIDRGGEAAAGDVLKAGRAEGFAPATLKRVRSHHVERHPRSLNVKQQPR